MTEIEHKPFPTIMSPERNPKIHTILTDTELITLRETSDMKTSMRVISILGEEEKIRTGLV